MTHRLTKSQLRHVLGVDNDAGLADFFEISRSAVAQWGEEEPVPELRQLQAERKRPDLFSSADKDIEPDPRPQAAGQGNAAAGSTDAPMSQAA